MFTYRQWGLVVHTLGKFLRKMYESLTSKFFLILPNHDHHLLGAISLNSKSEPLTVWQTLAGLKFDELNILLIFNRGQFWYSRVLLLLASTSVCLSQACPCDNSSHIKARTTKLGRDAKHIDYDLYCVWGCLALIFLVKFNLKVKIYPVLSYSSVKVKYWRPFSPRVNTKTIIDSNIKMFKHSENFWAFTGPRIDFGLILLISNMIIHRSFTSPTQLLSANVRGPVSFIVSGC